MQSSFAFSAFLFGLLSVTACSSETAAPAAPTTPISEHYNRIGSSLAQTIAGLKSSATTAGTVTPAAFASVAPVAKEATGGKVDITAEQTGKTGEKAANVDGVGTDETVSIFVPDVKASGTSTSATAPSFAAWRGDADSNDAGLCYLGFTNGPAWIVASKCDDASGAWVCQVTSEATSCKACNTAGTCNDCDVSQGSLSSCAWP